MVRLRLVLLFVVIFALVSLARAADSSFDLDGPPLDVKVTRNGKTLPLSEVPNLEPGDRVWLHPNLPEQQQPRYLLVTVFLRGSTNSPLETWFSRSQTWSQQVRDHGIYITVPQGAQQALFFLAPETGGDFSTLRSNVRAKPGVYVRASQDLNQASFDRARLDAYLAAVTKASESDPDALKRDAKLLSRSLNIKVDSDCFSKPASQQLACLTQNQNALVLDDGHTQSTVAALTSGASADLIGQLSATSVAGAGVYSPYVGAIVDVVRIMDGIHTAQYQYIPALAQENQDELQLKLNNPPSFSNPKSVLTVALPAVQDPQLPPLRAVNPDQVYCAESSSLVLPVEGAPLVYATGLGHDFVLRVGQKTGHALDLPASPEAVRGGFLVDNRKVDVAGMDPESIATLRGQWGFESFDGPSFRLESSRSEDWDLPGADRSALIIGREDKLHLRAESAVCVNDISVKDQAGKLVKASYKLVKPNELEVRVPLQDASPGPVTLLVQEAGLKAPDHIKMQTYSEAAHFDSFTIHAGDNEGLLQGTRLDEVSKLELKGIAFTPAALKRSDDKDHLAMRMNGDVTGLNPGVLDPGEEATAQVSLNDGRQVELAVVVGGQRPKVVLLSKSIEPEQTASPIRLTNPDELPQDGTFSFVLQAEIPSLWSRTLKVEVATADGSIHTMLNVEDGSLTLQDQNTALATLNPLKSFGPSAFGQLRFRAIDGNGTEGDWQPLGNLVRIPTLKEVQCLANPEKQCTLSGSNLFLLDSVAANSAFRYAVLVPIGFSSFTLNVPRPYGTTLYIKLRDDPSVANIVALPVIPE